MDYTARRMLVTAGPTWVAIDRVRVITSIFSGETGLRLARYFAHHNAQVTLLMGPGRAHFIPTDWQMMDVHHFFYYDELYALIKHLVQRHHFDIVLHSSAVADYKPIHAVDGKIPSNAESLSIPLVRTDKIVDYIRQALPKSFLVKFKLQVGTTPSELHALALSSLVASQADLIVANDLDEMAGEQHIAYILDASGATIKVTTKEELCRRLSEVIQCRYQPHGT